MLGRWLASKPPVLLLDEPTRGIDVGAKREIYGLIDALAHEGAAIVLVSSELPELLGLCDRILVLREGRVVREFGRGRDRGGARGRDGRDAPVPRDRSASVGSAAPTRS